MKVALIGPGTVGTGAIWATGTAKNNLAKHGIHIDFTEVYGIENYPDLNKKIRQFITPDQYFLSKDFSTPNADTVVVSTGVLEVDYEYIKSSIEVGKQVVTPNKAVMAKYGAQLFSLANEKGVALMCEAAVCGAVPIVRELKKLRTKGIQLGEGTQVEIIANGTTNFMLEQMSVKGLSFDDALELAQNKGFAEMDPSADINGWDTARKLAIIASIITGVEVDYKSFKVNGITPESLKGVPNGHTAKLIGSLSIGGNGKITSGKVCVKHVPNYHIFITGNVNGVMSGVKITSPQLKSRGAIFLKGKGAGGFATGRAVLMDLMRIAQILKESKEMQAAMRAENSLIGWSN